MRERAIQQSELRRTLGLSLVTLYGLGTILGAGIYVLIGKVAGIAGHYAPAAFLVSAVLASLTGYSYAQLSVRFPKSAGESLYIKNAFGRSDIATLIGWMVVTTGVVSSATLTRGFVGYLDTVIAMPENVVIFLILLSLALLACWGIAQSVFAASFITLIEIAGILLVIAALRENLPALGQIHHYFIPDPDPDKWLSICVGAFLAFYAFIGFEDMVNVVEETKTPEKTMPRAIFLAVGVSSLLYILVALVAVSSLSTESLSETDAPMSALLSVKNQKLALIISVISIVAIINGVLIQMIMGSRIIYGMSKQKIAPAVFSSIHTSTQTPVLATLFLTVLIWLFASLFPLITLAKITSFIVLVIFFLVNAAFATVVFRERKSIPRSSIHFIIGSIGALSCLVMLLIQLYSVATGHVAADQMLPAGH